MNLKLMTKWPDHMSKISGLHTNFPAKVLFGIEQNNLISEDQIDEYFGRSGIWPGLLRPKFGSDWIERYDSTLWKAKLNTIRKGHRWRPGMKIHFQVWEGKPYRSDVFQFCPTIECKSVQDITITRTKRSRNEAFITIDIDGITCWSINEFWGESQPPGDHGILLQKRYDLEFSDFTYNDGFDHQLDFLKFFNQPSFKGQIIHWTDTRYTQ